MTQESKTRFGGCIPVLITMCNNSLILSIKIISINSNIFIGQKFKFFDF